MNHQAGQGAHLFALPAKRESQGSSAMRKVIAVLAAAAVLAAFATPAGADGIRRAWRGPSYAVGAISHNVITPYYYGYYPSHYSYFAPDPVPAPIYYRYDFPAPRCWRWGYGYRYWAC